MKRVLIAFVAVVLLAVLLPACGAATTKNLTPQETLTVAMTGSFKAPADAAGNSEPHFETFLLKAVTLIKADGTVVEAFTTGPTPFRIIDRPQIIAQKSLADQVGVAFAAVQLQFDATVTGGGKYNGALSVALADAAPKYVGAYTVTKAKGLRLDVLVEWKDTVTRDDKAKSETVSSPAFTLDLNSN